MKPNKLGTIAVATFGLFIGNALFTNHMIVGGKNGAFIGQAKAAAMATFSTESDMKELIGRNIKNSAGETIGEVESVYVDNAGKISTVIVSVGGFLGMGDREVAIKWSDLNVTNDGKDVTTNISKDTLKAMPEYKYKNTSWRGTVFRD
jgi:sporulation protein YlmC with PRC-barrel domain